MVGTVDQDGKFHPNGLSVSSHEREKDYEFIFLSVKSKIHELFNICYKPGTLVADCAPAITNGFRDAHHKEVSNDDDELAIYTDFIRVYDWAHVNRNIRDELKHIRDKVQKEEVMADISKLRLSKSKQIFEAALKLFVIKWKSFDDEGIDKFIDSFEKDYVNQQGLCKLLIFFFICANLI